jgi:hypothetical protein
MKLDGIDGGHLFGFMAAVGTLALLDKHARSRQMPAPRLQFARDGTGAMTGLQTADALIEAAYDELQASRPFYEMDLAVVKKPTDFTPSTFSRLAANAHRHGSDILAGLACCVGEEAFESSLCAANGASHQNLVQSMRDVLSLVEKKHLRSALFAPWRKDYEVPEAARKQNALGTRKPTLRLDPADERLYAFRFSNPTTTSDFKTELGAQALAIPAFSVFPVLPQRRPLSVASERRGNRVFFTWSLWERPATLASVRSLLFAGIDRRDELRCRGAFAGFRAARVSGEKGKLSFAPTEGVW